MHNTSSSLSHSIRNKYRNPRCRSCRRRRRRGRATRRRPAPLMTPCRAAAASCEARAAGRRSSRLRQRGGGSRRCGAWQESSRHTGSPPNLPNTPHLCRSARCRCIVPFSSPTPCTQAGRQAAAAAAFNGRPRQPAARPACRRRHSPRRRNLALSPCQPLTGSTSRPRAPRPAAKTIWGSPAGRSGSSRRPAWSPRRSRRMRHSRCNSCGSAGQPGRVSAARLGKLLQSMRPGRWACSLPLCHCQPSPGSEGLAVAWRRACWRRPHTAGCRAGNQQAELDD